MVVGGEEGEGTGEDGVSADIVWRPDGPTDQGSETPGAPGGEGRGGEPAPFKRTRSATDVMRARMMKKFLNGTGSPHRRSVKDMLAILPSATEPGHGVRTADEEGPVTNRAGKRGTAGGLPPRAQKPGGSHQAPAILETSNDDATVGKQGGSGAGSSGDRSPWAVLIELPGADEVIELPGVDEVPHRALDVATTSWDARKLSSPETPLTEQGFVRQASESAPGRLNSDGSVCSSAAARAIMFNRARRESASPNKRKSPGPRFPRRPPVSVLVPEVEPAQLASPSARGFRSGELSVSSRKGAWEVDSDGECELANSSRSGGLYLGHKAPGSGRHIGCTLNHPLRPVVDQYDVIADDPAEQQPPKPTRHGRSSIITATSEHALDTEGTPKNSPAMQSVRDEDSQGSSRRRRVMKVPVMWQEPGKREREDSGLGSTDPGSKGGTGRHVMWSQRKHSDIAATGSARGGSEMASGEPSKNTKTRFVLEKARRRSASYKFSGENAGQGEDSLQLQILAYVRPISKIIVAILDLITALFVQLFWPIDDFACLHAEQGMWNEGHVRTQIITLISTILAFHAYMIILNLSETDSSDHLVILRFIRRWQVKHQASGVQLLAKLHVLTLALLRGIWRFAWDIFIFCLSVAALIAHRQLCDRFENAEKASGDWSYVFVRRLHLVVHFVRAFGALWNCMGLRAELERRVRAAVSLNKRRFVCKVTIVDLDLTYICDRLIGMAVPCVDGATVYRNNIRDVARFFASRHYGHFLIFNLCEDFEEGGNGNYDNALLYGQVQKRPMHDHNAPRLHDLLAYCEQASAWLDRHKDNVVAVHCQGGKGRTGCFCAALALWTNFKHDAKACLDYFAHRRTDRRRGKKHVQGVAAPCQIRYVHYLDALLEDRTIDCRSPVMVLLQSITVQTMPMHTKDSINVMFVVESAGLLEYDHFKEYGLVKMVRRNPAADEWTFDLKAVLLQGDVSVRFFVFEEDFAGPSYKDDRECRQTVMGNGARSIRVGRHIGKQLFFVSFHTSFHPGESVTFGKKEIDGAYNKRDEEFLPEFSLTLNFLKHEEAVEMHDKLVERSTESFNHLAQNLNPNQLLLLLSPSMQQKPGSGDRAEAGSNVAMAALHHYTNHLLVRDMLTKACPQTITFARGQTVWKDSMEGACNGVFYIVSGSCSWHTPGTKPWQVNNDMSLDGKPIGAGRFLGLTRFLLGPEAELGVLEVRAWSEEVVVRRLLLKRSNEGHVPLVIEGFTDKEVQVVYEKMARDMWFEEQNMQEMLRRLTIMASAKHDTTISMPRAERQRQTRAIVDRFKIPASEHLIEHIKANRVPGETVDTGQPSEQLRGSMYLFSSYIIFSGSSSTEGDLLMPIKNIVEVTMDCGAIVITVSSDESAADPKDPNTSMLASFHPSKRRNTIRRHSIEGSPLNLKGYTSFESGSKGTLESTVERVKSVWGRIRSSAEDSVQIYTTCSGILGMKSSSVSSLEHLVENQGIVTFYFRPASAMSGSQLCEAIKNRIDEVSKILTIKDLERAGGAKRDDESGNGFGYVYSDDPVDEGGAAGVLQFLFQTSSVLHFMAGQVIAYEGATEKQVFHVLSGKVFLCNIISGTVAKEMFEGDLFGTALLLQTGNRGMSFRAVAAEDTEVLALSEENIRLIASLKPMVGVRIFRNIAMASALRAQSDILTLKAWETLSYATTD